MLPPRAGELVFACRAGFEAHLYEELVWRKAQPRPLGEGLVAAAKVPGVTPAFGRAWFRAEAALEGDDPAAFAHAAREWTERALSIPGGRVAVQGWTPDTDEGNRHAGRAAALQAQLEAQLPGEVRLPAGRQPDLGTLLGQVLVVGASQVWLGAVNGAEAASLYPGGRARMWREAGPSRAALKLEEALTELRIAPGKGETCVDLGAAPGGWSARLLERGARVVAVDPARLAPDLMRHPKLAHVQESAFAYAPDEPADWLFCDMAWRPLEVAQLLAKWARRGWASFLVANLKLPMKDKNPVIHRARSLLEEAGWAPLRVRQLYHDRDEVTVMGARALA
jgi:23S rRNA (cytidine2498-2'-O)-methyltransferase